MEREAQRAGEADGAQRAQPVLREARLRVAHRPQHAPGEVLRSPERIAQPGEPRLQRVPGHRVDREIPARQVALDVAEEGHRAGSSAILVRALAAERGHLDLVLAEGVAGEHSDGPVRKPGRRGAREEALHLFGQGVGRHVEVLGRGRLGLAGREGPGEAEQVAHRSPCEERLLAAPAQRPQHLEDGCGHERRVGRGRH